MGVEETSNVETGTMSPIKHDNHSNTEDSDLTKSEAAKTSPTLASTRVDTPDIDDQTTACIGNSQSPPKTSVVMAVNSSAILDDDDGVIAANWKPTDELTVMDGRKSPSTGLSEDEDEEDEANFSAAKKPLVRAGPSTGLTDSESESEDEMEVKSTAKVRA